LNLDGTSVGNPTEELDVQTNCSGRFDLISLMVYPLTR
jgi:hypothetical protein